MHPLVRRAHLSRFEIWIRDRESQIQIVCAFGCETRNVEGPPGLPGRPFTANVCLHVTRVVDLRRYPYRAPSGRYTSSYAPRGCSRPRIVPIDYVELVSTRDVPGVLIRITARERSVKRFVDEIHNHASRLLFRHRGDFSNATIVL